MYGEYMCEVEVVLDERQNVASVTGVVFVLVTWSYYVWSFILCTGGTC